MTEATPRRFSPNQVRNLEEFQRARVMHPFTCPNRSDEAHHGSGELVATVRGWICQYCDYTQDWAHDFMMNGEAVANSPIHKIIAAANGYDERDALLREAADSLQYAARVLRGEGIGDPDEHMDIAARIRKALGETT